MPEGPSLVILRELAEPLVGLKVKAVEGNSRIGIERLKGRRLQGVHTWGKHFLMEFDGLAVRVHMLMFGSYCIDSRKDRPPRLALQFSRRRELNFYSSAVRFIEEPLDDVYDWSGDVMSDNWNPRAARRKLKAMPDALAADVLLNQDVFAGVGNIIKNEVLHRIRVHPESLVGDLPPRKLGDLIREARQYSFDFLEWKKQFVLRKHWHVHAKKTCPRDGTPLSFCRHLGLARRRAFWCDTCQRRYGPAPEGACSPQAAISRR